MAHQRETGRNGASIAKAGKHKWGYDVSQVNSFLERAHTLYEDAEPKMTQEDIQNVSFALEKDGYVISQVDAALNRLEKAVVDKQTQWDVASFGRVAWRATTEQLAHSLYPRSERPEKDRFSPGEDKKPSYDRKQVDRLVAQIVGKIRRELGESDRDGDVDDKADAELTSMRVSNIIFTQRTGRRGYSERQVDAYLNRAVQVLSRLESFARLEGPLSKVGVADADADAPAAPVRAAVQSAPAPLNKRPTEMLFNTVPQPKNEARTEPLEGYGYAPRKAAAPAPAQDAGGNGGRDSSFYDLRKAENEIFSGNNDGLPFAQSPAAAVSGSLAGLVNATGAAAKSQAPAADTSRRPSAPEPSPLEETAAYTPDDLPAPPAPAAAASHRFDFASSPAPASAPATGTAPSPAMTPAAQAPTVPPSPASPAVSSPASGGNAVPEPSPALGQTEAYSFDFDALDGAGKDDAGDDGIRTTPYLASSYESAYAPAPSNTSATTGTSAVSHAPDVAPAGTAPKKDDAGDAAHRASASEADDYLSSLLDTSSIPALDFHIPSLTFPTDDEKKS
ncbi:DivIVA domain-containing protein [Bifidobacterium sp. 82T24]|uniref:DivIVA domain-containing protein n=1 Tax=Bifidobacterium pluvialisilvae TaxID=2834436 RepID=UPI001C599F21|nr:DivIVA domain-containing protein [Bifidobacterium pluvialisilvae]MBW3087716.1 DivIVA domain-containing protein [Bifidobacterium pluvialisilvae]